MTNALVKPGFSLTPTSLAEALQFAKLMADSDFVPKEHRGKPGNIVLAVQLGAEVGLSPMQALQNIAIINGKPCVWGDAMLAICQGHREFEDIIEECDGNVATCTVKRKGRSPTVRKFSKADAKQAGLLGKQGPWSQYPERMLQMRARAFALRDSFADALRGVNSAEEVGDYQEPVHIEAKVTNGRHSLKASPPAEFVAPSANRPSVDDLIAEVNAAETILAAKTVYAKAMKDFGYTKAELEPLASAGSLRVKAIEAREALSAMAAEDGEPAHDPETGEVIETQAEFGF